MEEEDIVYCVEAEMNSKTNEQVFYVVAQEVTIKKGTVFYYEREKLQENKRIASWI